MKALIIAAALALMSACVPVTEARPMTETEKLTYEWDGRAPMDEGTLRTIVRTAVAKTEWLPTDEGFIELIVETAAAESGLGHYNMPHRLTASRGTFQILTSTADDTLHWMRAHHREAYDFALSIAGGGPLKDILERRVAFGAVICGAVYMRQNRDKRPACSTRDKRARAWKRLYNTPAGAGMMDEYKERCKRMLGK